VAYHSETLSNIIQKYTTYEKQMYSIVQAYRQWNHYILGKETFIHTNRRTMQFIQMEGKLQNDRHQKWSTYLQKFHLNIMYKKGITNNVADCLSRPLIMALTSVLNSCRYETYDLLSTKVTQNSATHTRCSWRVYKFQIFTSKMPCYAT